jgi:hypothetical protein
LKHTASIRSWECFEALPAEIQALARRNYELMRNDPSHPSLQFRAVANGKLHSVRVGLYYRALGVPVTGGVHWFWIGSHAEYDKLVG